MVKDVQEKKKNNTRTSKKNVMELDLLDEPKSKSKTKSKKILVPKDISSNPSNIVKSRKLTSIRKKTNTFDQLEFDSESKKLEKLVKRINIKNIKTNVSKKEFNDNLGKKYCDDMEETELDSDSSLDSNVPVSTDTVKKNSKYFNSQIRAYASIQNTDKILKITKTTNMRTKSIMEEMEIMKHQMEIIKDSLEQKKERFNDENDDAPSIEFAPIVSDEIELDPSQKKNIPRLVDEFKGFIDLTDEVIRQHLGKHTSIADINLLKICYIRNIPKNKVCIRCLSDQNYQYYADGEWHSDKYGRYIREVLAKNVMQLYMSVNKMEYYFPDTPHNGISLNNNKSSKELEKEKMKQETYTRNLEYISTFQKASPTKRERYEKDLLNRLKPNLFYKAPRKENNK